MWARGIQELSVVWSLIIMLTFADQSQYPFVDSEHDSLLECTQAAAKAYNTQYFEGMAYVTATSCIPKLGVELPKKRVRM